MAFREVTMIEVKEALRQWLAGAGKKRIGARVGLDPKTVRRYVRASEACGLTAGQGDGALTDEVLGEILARLAGAPVRPHGDSWQRCEEQRAFIEEKLRSQVRLSKVRRLLHRHGVDVPYSTLHRFAVGELGFGRRAVTVPVVDGEPGHELQVDTGWMTLLEPDAVGRRRRFRAWIFTPNVSRYRFVYPCFSESTATAIEACEAAWEFYGGVFRVLLPDNTKAIVQTADPLEPLLNEGFLEYAQARGFHIDPARVRTPTDKGRVERSVRDVRDDCFGGERMLDLEHARFHSRRWCEEEYGMRRHSTTYRLPREHFSADEKTALVAAPTAPFDVPTWADPTVARDHFAQVARSLYSLPTRFIGKQLRARADVHLVRFYDAGILVKTHPRQPRGGRSIDPADFPQERRPYAMRDVAFLAAQAREIGPSIGTFAARLLEGPLPWTRMRAVRALTGLARKFGAARLDDACARALAADMLSVHRLARMLEIAAPAITTTTAAKVIPLGRYLRPAKTFAVHSTKEGELA
jgi:transposase